MKRFVLATLIVFAVVAAPARAQSPQGCTGNLFQAGLNKDRTVIRDGETINYTVSVDNDVPSACDAAEVTLQFQAPSQAGTPSATIQTLTNKMLFPFGTKGVKFGPFPFTAHFGANPPSTFTARLSKASGYAVDTPVPPGSPLNIDRDVNTITVQPGLSIDKTANTTGGPAPQTVIYSYAVKNITLPLGLPNDITQMSNVIPTDNLCSPMTLISGDTNNDKKMQITETWNYTCTSTFTQAGTYTNTAKVCGDETADSIPMNFCSPPDTWTVTVTTPPPVTPPVTPETPATPTTPAAVVPQQPAIVLPAAQPTPPKVTGPCLDTPGSLRVRAKEQTTVRVTVKGGAKGILVKVTGPGVNRSARTDANGVATIKVRPTRSGRLTITTPQCSTPERVSVLAARKVAAQRVPRVTG